MHHATTQNFKPARILADLATLAAADKTFHIHFCGWFREWKIGCAKTGAHILSKHATSKIDQRALQISESNILANGETFHLIELNLRTRGNLLVTKTHSW